MAKRKRNKRPAQRAMTRALGEARAAAEVLDGGTPEASARIVGARRAVPVPASAANGPAPTASITPVRTLDTWPVDELARMDRARLLAVIAEDVRGWVRDRAGMVEDLRQIRRRAEARATEYDDTEEGRQCA